MNAHPKIPTAYGSTVKARESHDPDANCTMRGGDVGELVPTSMDGIFKEMDAKREAASDRKQVKRGERA